MATGAGTVGVSTGCDGSWEVTATCLINWPPGAVVSKRGVGGRGGGGGKNQFTINS